jgi:hypothetical protein
VCVCMCVLNRELDSVDEGYTGLVTSIEI